MVVNLILVQSISDIILKNKIANDIIVGFNYID